MKRNSHGVYYSAFTLLSDARHLDDLGKRPEVRLHRDETGRIDGMELLTETPTVGCVECGGTGSLDVGGAIALQMPCPSCDGLGYITP